MPRLRLLLSSSSPLALLLAAMPALAQTPAPSDAPVRAPSVSVEGNASTQAPISEYKTEGVSLPKFTAPLLDTAKTIEVVPRQVMDDQGVTNFRDALRNVPGLSIAAGEGGSQGDTLTIRGFPARGDIFMDGMRDFGSYYRDPFYLDSIEVLKGPAGIVFGRGSTGGVVNQVVKAPTLEGFTAFGGAVGTDFTKRMTLDYDRALPEIAPGAAFRVNILAHNSNVAGRDVVENTRFGFAPSLAFGIGTDTRWNFSYIHQTSYDIPDYGVPWLFQGAANTGTLFAEPARVNRSNYYGFRNGNFMRTNVDVATAKYEHDFSDALSIRNQSRYGHYTRQFKITEPQINGNVGAGGANTIVSPGTSLAALTVTRNQLSGTSLETFLQNQTDLTAKLKTGTIEHTVVTGMELTRETSGPRRDTARTPPGNSTTDLLNPNPDNPFNAGIRPNTRTDVNAWGIAAYALDTLKFNDQWSFTAGLRLDRFEAHSLQRTFNQAANGFITSTPPTGHYDAIATYRTALVYKPLPNGSVYFDYGTSFNPSAENLALAANTAALDPETSSTMELGTKWDLMREKLSVTAALFQSEKQNLREADPLNANQQILAGNAIAKGFELGVTGKLTDNWNILAGYAYTFSKITSSPQGDIGQRLANTPLHTANIWTTYKTPWKVTVGGGVNYIGSRLASSNPRAVTNNAGGTTSFIEKAPGYWTANAMAEYPVTEHATLQLNVTNLFNKAYLDQLHPSHAIPGAGRTALLSMNVKY